MMKLALLLLLTLTCICCRQNKQSESDDDYSKEIVITGRILNRDFYPNEKTLTLTIPSFRNHEVKYVSPISEEQTFSFRFKSYAAMREVCLRNYAEHLYVRPGDSLHIEIDFKDLLHPQITGTLGELNMNMSIFTDGGYYMRAHNCKFNNTPELFEEELRTEYKERLMRREQFLEKYNPGEEVEQLTVHLLKVDYNKALYRYANRYCLKNRVAGKYDSFLANIDTLFSDKIISADMFDLTQLVFRLLEREQYIKNRRETESDSIIELVKGNAIAPYFYASLIGDALLTNDTTYFSMHRAQFDSIVKAPHLRYSVYRLYNATKKFLTDSKEVSDYMLYGRTADSPDVQQDMTFMTPVYQLLEKYKGKVIYFDFWGTVCPPCLAEMEPLKKLREQYSLSDVVMISICISGRREDYENILKRFDLKNRGIECMHVEDWTDRDSYRKIMKHWEFNGIPQFLLVNPQGVITDYGSALRPSKLRTKERIDEALRWKRRTDRL